MGCESLQKKFTRKKPYVRPAPIVSFQDYTRAMTPLDRYRKHYALFDYWNSELLATLQGSSSVAAPGTGQSSINPKRAKLASQESLQELHTLQGLLQDDQAVLLQPILDERAQINDHVQKGSYSGSQLSALVRLLDAQTRRIHREFFWRRVEDRLKVDERTTEPAPPAATSDANRD